VLFTFGTRANTGSSTRVLDEIAIEVGRHGTSEDGRSFVPASGEDRGGKQGDSPTHGGDSGAVGNMEAAVKVVMTEQGDLQKWKPEVEAKVTEIADALKAIQIQMGKMEKKSFGFGSRQEEEGEDGFLKPPPSDSSNLEFHHEEGGTQFSHGGMNSPWNSNSFRFEAAGNHSFGDWSHGSGSGIPSMSSPAFDGSNPKLWRTRCETYFDFYSVARPMWIRLAIMHFEGATLFWLQYVEHRLRYMKWDEFCSGLYNRFGRDQHGTLIRHFYHIHQHNLVVEYVEQFDILLHQLLAHESQLTPMMITSRFVDGLKDEIWVVVSIQRLADLDTACSLALLQEDMLTQPNRKEGRRVELGGYSRASMKTTTMAGHQVSVTTSRIHPLSEVHRRPSRSSGRTEDQKLAALKSYRRAKGLCFKCGEKWNYNHHCSNSVPLHVV
jgi:hypothetical protein